MGEPRQHTLDRVRPIKRTLTYNVETNGNVVRQVLPFVVCVLADFTGDNLARTPLRDQKLQRIDRDNFDEVMSKLAPRLALQVPHLSPDSVELHFREMADFKPDRVQERLPTLALHGHLGEIIHHPGFQRLEAVWRGLCYLVHNTETSDALWIVLLDVSKQALARDLCREDDVGYSQLYQKIHNRPLGQPPVSFIVADYEFDRTEEDIRLLSQLSKVCAECHTPLVAGASPRLFGIDSFTQFSNVNLKNRLNDGDHGAWNHFRASKSSRYIALTLPRVLSRLPWKDSGEGAESDQFLWMNAAWACAAKITDAFAKSMWFTNVSGATDGKVEGLPVCQIDSARTGATEIALDDRQEWELAVLGFLPLVHCAGGLPPVFFTFQSCQKPLPIYDHDPSSQFNYLLCACRIVHHLQVMCETMIPGDMAPEDIEQRLKQWLNNYIFVFPEGYAPDFRFPTFSSDSMVQVQECQKAPGTLEIHARLSPRTAIEESAVPGIQMIVRARRWAPLANRTSD